MGTSFHVFSCICQPCSEPPSLKCPSDFVLTLGLHFDSFSIILTHLFRSLNLYWLFIDFGTDLDIMFDVCLIAFLVAHATNWTFNNYDFSMNLHVFTHQKKFDNADDFFRYHFWHWFVMLASNLAPVWHSVGIKSMFFCILLNKFQCVLFVLTRNRYITRPDLMGQDPHFSTFFQTLFLHWLLMDVGSILIPF